MSTGESADKAIDLSGLARAVGEAAEAGSASGDGGDGGVPAEGDAAAEGGAGAQADEGDPVDAAATGTDVATDDAYRTPEELTAAYLADGSLPDDYGLTAWAERSQGLFDPFLIGDSVPGDSDFYSWFPDGFIDSYIGRQPYQGLAVLQDYMSQGGVGHVVVMACFSNSTPDPETLDAMVEAVGPDREIYFVGTVNPEGFQDAANQNLIDCANRHDNAHYIDWPAASAGHGIGDWFWNDGTHLRPEGSVGYLNAIRDAITADVVAAGGLVSQG